MRKNFIPVSEPWFTGKELEYVQEAIKSTFISSEGKYIEEFESKFASYIGRKFGIACTSGTNALILALRALELEKGSEVILPSFTIISCALAVIYNDLVPVFIDSEKATWDMNPDEIERKITPKTKAILMVHTYGFPCDVEKITKIAQKHNLYIIEDFAEAIGSEYKGAKCGNFGIISCTSFYANKLITTGEGGMCLTDDEKLAKKMKILRNLSFIPEKRFLHYELGFNFRMTNIQAAIGLAQLENIEERIRRKIFMGQLYSQILKPLENDGIISLPPQDPQHKNTFWMYGVLLKNGITADEIMKKLHEIGIQTRPFFYPLHLQPAFEKFPWFKKEKLSISEYLGKYGFYLPSGLTLDEKKIKFVAQSLIDILTK